jgi:UV DNA damage repair endonuclease
MVEHERTGKDLVLRNRLVLEDIYPEALRTQNSFASELAAVSMSLSLVSSNWSNVIVSNMVLKPYMTLMREADVSQKGLDEIRKLVSDQTSAALETFRNVAFVDASLSRISSDVLPILNQFAEGAERRAKVIQYLSFFCYFFGAILVIWGKIIEGKSRRSSDGGDTAEADV